MILVVDASVVVKWFVKEEGHDLALGLLERGSIVVAPDLVFAETANVLWKKLKLEQVTRRQIEQACTSLPDFFAKIVPSQLLLNSAIEFALRLGHSVYDCVYLASAERLAVKLVTGDTRFLRKARSSGLEHLVASLEEADAFGRNAETQGIAISQADMRRLLELSGRFERTLSFVQEMVSRPQGEFGVFAMADLSPAFLSPTYRRLADALEDLSHGQLRDLVALAWLGRGYDGSDWRKLRDHADGMLGADPLRHRDYIIGLIYYVSAGMEKIDALAKGRSTDDPQSK